MTRVVVSAGAGFGAGHHVPPCVLGDVERLIGRVDERSLVGFDFGPDRNLYVAHREEILRFDGVTGEFIDVFIASGNPPGVLTRAGWLEFSLPPLPSVPPVPALSPWGLTLMVGVLIGVTLRTMRTSAAR